jgi:biotin operon repressor
MTEDRPDLSDRQQDLVDELPAKTPDIAEALGISESTVESYRNAIKDKGYPLEYDRETRRWYLDGEHDVGDDEPTEADTEDSDEADTDDDPPETPDLDDLQGRAIRELPATVNELGEVDAEHDGHQILELLREDGIEVGYDPAPGKYYLADERSEQLRAQTHLSLTAKTKRAKQHLREEQAILDRLPDTTPLTIDNWEPDPEKETMVAAVGDIHFGDEVKDDRGRTVYDAAVAHEAVDRFAEKVIRNKRQWSASFDELVLCVMGDVATGTTVYKTQKNDIGDLLSQQIQDGAQALTRLVATLREHFEAVRVAAIVGNHGFQDPSAARGSNTDLTCYYWMRDGLRREGYDDVEITLAEHTHHLNIEVRGWRLHMRHGQDTKKHVDETASSKAEWRGWRDKHKFDIGLRAHHHVPSFHYVLNRYPVVTIPSPKPGGEFADRIGDPDASTPADREEERKLGYCFGVSSERRVTDSRMTDAG